MLLTPLIIVLSVLLLLFVLLMIRGHATVEYRDSVTVRISILGIPFWRYPKKKKKIRLSDYTPKKLEKKKRREARLQDKRKKRLAKKAKRRGEPSAGSTPAKKRGLLENLGLIREILTVLIGKSAKHIRVHADRILINVATDDAAKTAILFGAVNQAVVGILELLDQTQKLSVSRSSTISVKADFAAQKSTADISITLSLRVWQILKVLFHTALQYTKTKTKPRSSPKQS